MRKNINRHDCLFSLQVTSCSIHFQLIGYFEKRFNTSLLLHMTYHPCTRVEFRLNFIDFLTERKIHQIQNQLFFKWFDHMTTLCSLHINLNNTYYCDPILCLQTFRLEFFLFYFQLNYKQHFNRFQSSSLIREPSSSLCVFVFSAIHFHLYFYQWPLSLSMTHWPIKIISFRTITILVSCLIAEWLVFDTLNVVNYYTLVMCCFSWNPLTDTNGF